MSLSENFLSLYNSFNNSYILSGFLSLLMLPITLFIVFSYKKSLSKKNYKIITKFDELKPYIEDIKAAYCVGIDTEYYKGEYYKGHLCIIQIHIEKYDFSLIIDIISLSKEEKQKIYPFINEILNNDKIEKIFHSCYNDIEWIKEETGGETRNIFDTQEMNQLIKHNNSFKSLNELMSEYLNIHFSLEEKKKFQKSNWYDRPLSKAQLTYAANDALYLIRIRNKMMLKLKDKKAIQQRKKEIEEKIYKLSKNQKNESKVINYMVSNMTKCDLELYDTIQKLFCELYQKTDDYAQKNNINTENLLSMKTLYKICGYLPKTKEEVTEIISLKVSEEQRKRHQDFYDKISEIILSKTQSTQKPNTINSGKTGHILKSLKKDLCRDKTAEKFSCKHPIYESCQMQAPDGEVLCYCDSKKMNWYISRGLAKLVSEDPCVFKLIFEPNARGCKDEDDKDSKFYISERRNRCVICGNEDNYMRFHVIPIIYRQHFPEHLKSHKSHDVNLLCFKCTEMANKVYEKKKEEISKRYNVPLNIMSEEQKFYKLLEELIKKCKSLYKNWNTLPYEKKEQLQDKIFNMIREIKNKEECFKDTNPNLEVIETIKKKGYFNLKDGLEVDLTVAGFIKGIKLKEVSVIKKNIHGKLVVDQIKDLKSFIREWRQFFLDSFHPQFLSKEWSVDHEMERTFGKFSNFKNGSDIKEQKESE